jgi:cytochrome P450
MKRRADRSKLKAQGRLSSSSSATLLDLLLDARDSSDGTDEGSATSVAGVALAPARLPLTMSDPELLDNAVTFLLAGSADTCFFIHLIRSPMKWVMG